MNGKRVRVLATGPSLLAAVARRIEEERRRDEAHRTTDTGRLAPHPGMTEDDLRDFESWAEEVEGSYRAWPLLTFGAGLLLWIAVWWAT